MLIIGLIETALELVPPEITADPAVVASAKTRGKPPERILLDETLHSKALQTLPNAEKRGRPDIAHRSLLTALDSVLAREKQLELFVHTVTDQIILIQPGTRLPRRMPRFIGLMEQLLVTNRVPITGPPLLEIYPTSLKTYLQELKPSKIYLLSQDGTPTDPAQFAQSLLSESKPVVLVGGFAHKTIRPQITQMVHQQVSFDPEPLPTSTVVGMLIHSMENALKLATRRFEKTN